MAHFIALTRRFAPRSQPGTDARKEPLYLIYEHLAGFTDYRVYLSGGNEIEVIENADQIRAAIRGRA